VFKYAFGPKIWEKIVAAAKPDEALGEEPISAFDPVNGADFLLKMQLNESTKQYNYDASRFNSKKPLFDGDDDKIEEVMNQLFDIQLEVSPDKFKTEEELADKFLWVTGAKDKKSTQAAKQKEFDAGDDELSKLSELVKKDEKKERKPIPMPKMETSDDDDSAFFNSLLND
jgi:hypothetical protein